MPPLPCVSAADGNALTVKIIHEQDQFFQRIAVFAVGVETNTPVVDMEKRTKDWPMALGSTNSVSMFAPDDNNAHEHEGRRREREARGGGHSRAGPAARGVRAALIDAVAQREQNARGAAVLLRSSLGGSWTVEGTRSGQR